MTRMLVILGLLSAACGVRRASEEDRIADTLEILASAPTGAFHGKLLSLRTREFATFGDLLEDAAASRVVYVGETHPNPVHHEFQETVVRAMRAADPRLAIGLEMFPREDQAALDDLVAGRIGPDELARRTGGAERWGPAWDLAGPLLRLARETGIPLVALDLDPEIARRIGRDGLEGLTEAEHASLPVGPVVNEDHVRYLLSHDLEIPRDLERLDHLVRAMCARDDVMADSIVRFLESPAGRDRRMVVLVGSGHVRRRLGIPDRVARRTGWPQLVIVPEEIRAGTTGVDWRALVTGDDGDLVLLTPPAPEEGP